MVIKFNKDTIVRNTLSIILLIMLLIVEGCIDLVDLSFNINKIYNVAFWINVIVYAVIMVIVRLIAYIWGLPNVRAKNIDLFKVERKNAKLMGFKDDKFPKWIDNVKNIEIKIEAWKLYLNKKLVRLEKRARIKDRTLWNSNPDDPTQKILRDQNKYCRKKQDILNQLDDKWIETNADTLPVKHYVRLNSAVFDIPVNISSKKSIYQLQSKERIAMIGILSFTAAWLVVWRSMLQVLDYTKNDAYWVAILLGILMDLGFMVYQFISGIMDAYKLVKNEEVLPYSNRNRILTEYAYYKNRDEEHYQLLRNTLNQMDTEIEQDADKHFKKIMGA